MGQFTKGETFTDVSPGKTVTSTRLNNHVDGATLLNGAVLDQTEKTITVAADTVLLGDSTLAASGVPKKVQLTNLLPETIRQGVQQYQGTDTGSANIYAVALSPAATAYTAGMIVRFKAGTANTTASTLNVNGLGAKNILTRAGAALAANDILASQICECLYDGTQFQLIGAISAGEVTATHATEANRQSVHQYAAGAGTANAQTVTLTPAATAYTAGMTVKFKASVANTSATTLNVSGLGVKDIKRVVAGAVADLKANDIQVADLVEAVYDGTQFLITSRIRSWDFVDAAQALPGSSAVLTRAHGLGAKPTKLRVVLINVITNLGYIADDEVDITSGASGWQPRCDATNVYVAQQASATPAIIPAAGGGAGAIVAADWNILIRASL